MKGGFRGLSTKKLLFHKSGNQDASILITHSGTGEMTT